MIRPQTKMKGPVCVVLGAQWGDEGKGKLVDVLANQGYDLVARFNGGNNAGHTLVIDGKKYAFHMLPCGLPFKRTLNLLGNGTVVHLPSVFREMDALPKEMEVKGRVKISDRAHLLFDFHQGMDAMQEDQRGAGEMIGTTRRGIGPCYASKANRNSIRVGDLVDWKEFLGKYNKLAELHAGFFYDRTGEILRMKQYRDRLISEKMLVDGTFFVHEALRGGKRLLCEGANAAMLDLDHGTYPYVTSSSTTAGGVCTGLGLPPNKISCTIGVVKAYTTRVGAGPFPTELTDDLSGGCRERGAPGTEVGEYLQRVGAEVGVTTGRKRRCGWLDLAALKYSNMLNGYSFLNLTKLDVLDGLDEIKLGVAYEFDGDVLPDGMMPSNLDDLARVQVKYEVMKGWKKDISKVRKYEDLPQEAREYVERIETLVGVKIAWIGVGADREAMLFRDDV